MLPKLYKIAHPRTPWRVVYSDPSQRDHRGKTRRFVKHFKLEKAARAYHAKLMRSAATVGTSGLSMDARARADHYAAKQILEGAGFAGMSTTEAMRRFVETQPATQAKLALPVAELVPLFVTAKEVEENAAHHTVDNLRKRVTAWVKREGVMTLADINEVTLLALKQRKGVEARTKINDMAAVSSFLSWLKERGLRGPNELLEMNRPATDGRIPKLLTPEQVRRLLEAAQEQGGGRLLKFFSLLLLAGLRPNEAAQVRPEQVRLTAKPAFVRVLRGKKRNHPRPAPVLKNFRAWWNAARWPEPWTDEEKKGEALVPLFRETRDRRLFNRIREAAGILEVDYQGKKWMTLKRNEWQQDICRHTWISVRLHQTKDEARVAYEAGTSVDMIEGHYRDTLDDRQVRAIESCRPAKRKGLTAKLAPARMAA